jgi:membrane dipeptidase
MQDMHFSSPVVDAHCDSLTEAMDSNRRLGRESDCGQVDFPRLARGGVNLQFFAAFISPRHRDNPLARALEIFDFFHRETSDNAGAVAAVYSFADIKRALTERKLAALLTVEGGEALAGRLEVLRMFYRLGVRSLTLTWNGRNELGDGAGEWGTGGGLTRFGVAVVKEMNRLGMLVDVSHLSPRGFWDVLSHTGKPVVASHSNCRGLCDHPRNLADDQIKALASAGGVMGLCFYPEFVHKKEANLEALLDHAEHVAALAGTDCIGLGSDFDGMDATIDGLKDVTSLPLVTGGLIKRGFSKEEVEKIIGGNFLRVLEQVL